VLAEKNLNQRLGKDRDEVVPRGLLLGRTRRELHVYVDNPTPIYHRLLLFLSASERRHLVGLAAARIERLVDHAVGHRLEIAA